MCQEMAQIDLIPQQMSGPGRCQETSQMNPPLQQMHEQDVQIVLYALDQLNQRIKHGLNSQTISFGSFSNGYFRCAIDCWKSIVWCRGVQIQRDAIPGTDFSGRGQVFIFPKYVFRVFFQVAVWSPLASPLLMTAELSNGSSFLSWWDKMKQIYLSWGQNETLLFRFAPHTERSAKRTMWKVASIIAKIKTHLAAE